MRAKRMFTTLSGESGLTLIETLAALAIIGVVVVAVLSGIGTASKAFMVADEQSTAESLARLQVEWVKNASYVYSTTNYTAAPVPSSTDYTGYSVNISAAALHAPDDGIQKVTVAINHRGRTVVSVDSYKVDR